MDPAAARPAPAWQGRRSLCACRCSPRPDAPSRSEEEAPSWCTSFLLRRDRIGDLHRDEGRLRCQLLLPPTQKARSDPIAARHLRGARVGPGCLFENPQLVCVIEPAPMPFTRAWTMGAAGGEEG